MSGAVISEFILNNGRRMPSIGIGTFTVKTEEKVASILDSALKAGYRLIDTASVYKNESHIGKVLPELLEANNLKRKDVFITSKLSPKDLDGERAQTAFYASLEKLGLDYIDLYLIHWPGRQGIKTEDPRNYNFRKDAWCALEKIYLETDKMRSLGVSNFCVNHLKQLQDYGETVPAVLQSEFHPDYLSLDVRNYCHDNNIHFQAYSSLGQGRLINDDRFQSLAAKYDKTIPQLLLRWGLQHNCSVLPKSVDCKHICENFDINSFVISDDDMDIIEAKGKHEKYAWDPVNVT